jgi:pimeloyl-ACP methyl ester carboxylesterase
VPTFRTSDGVNLSYLQEGRGRPVVLIHGYTAPAAAWALTTDALVATGYGVRVRPTLARGSRRLRFSVSGWRGTAVTSASSSSISV